MKFLAAFAAAALMAASAAPAFAQTAPATTPTPGAVKAEPVLRSTIADLQAGKPKLETMSPELAEAVKAQSAMQAQLASLGPVKGVVFLEEKDGADVFAVAFEAGITLNWIIALDAGGKIIGLRVTQ